MKLHLHIELHFFQKKKYRNTRISTAVHDHVLLYSFPENMFRRIVRCLLLIGWKKEKLELISLQTPRRDPKISSRAKLCVPPRELVRVSPSSETTPAGKLSCRGKNFVFSFSKSYTFYYSRPAYLHVSAEMMKRWNWFNLLPWFDNNVKLQQSEESYTKA